jgi:hypothetical protein
MTRQALIHLNVPAHDILRVASAIRRERYGVGAHLNERMKTIQHATKANVTGNDRADGTVSVNAVLRSSVQPYVKTRRVRGDGLRHSSSAGTPIPAATAMP